MSRLLSAFIAMAPSPGQGEGWGGGRNLPLALSSDLATFPCTELPWPVKATATFRPPPQPVLQTAPSQRLGPAAGVLGPQDPITSGRSPCPGAGGIRGHSA